VGRTRVVLARPVLLTLALNGGPQLPFTESVSLVVDCADQAEVDSLWNPALGRRIDRTMRLAQGQVRLSWQIVPRVVVEMLQDYDPGASATRDECGVEDDQAGHRGAASGVRGQLRSSSDLGSRLRPEKTRSQRRGGGATAEVTEYTRCCFVLVPLDAVSTRPLS